MPDPIAKRSLKPAPNHSSRSMWASLLLHSALILWLGVYGPFGNRAEREASLDDYVTQVAVIDIPEPKVIEPDPPTPKVPEIEEEETPLEKIHEVVVENPAPEAVSSEPPKLAEPAGVPSWSEVKIKYRPAPSIAAALAPSSGSTAGGKGVIGAGSGSTGESTGAGPQFVQAKSVGPGAGTGTSPFLAATGSSSTGIGRRAHLKTEINPSYPESMRKEGQTAVVQLLVSVGIDGRAQEVKVLSEKVNSEFIEPAVSAARNARYEPALENGKPIASNMRISIRFVLQ